MGFEHLFSWIPELIGFILSWFPHGARLQTYEGGVVISGENVREIEKGRRHWSTLWLLTNWYWHVPRFSTVYVENIKRKVKELPDQLLTTKDGCTVRAGGVLVYSISNVVTWLVENEDPEDGVKVEAARALREWVKGHSFAEIQDYSPKGWRDDELSKAAQNAFGADFGVRLGQLALAGFALTESRDVHHSGIAAAPVEVSDEE